MINFLDWIARAGGFIALLVVTIGFLFREKWKQILQRSLAEDLERLKNELAKNHAEHAASLVPQIEQIKHDFQQKLEAYKVSLIAETEAVKAKGELRKSIALRYSEIEFERLVSLEHIVAPITSELLAMALIDVENKSVEHSEDSMAKIRALSTAAEEAAIFMEPDDNLRLIQFRQKLLGILSNYIGPSKPQLPDNHQDMTDIVNITILVHAKLKERIGALGKL